MFKVNNKDTRTTPYFTPCFYFEHVIAGWERAKIASLTKFPDAHSEPIQTSKTVFFCENN